MSSMFSDNQLTAAPLTASPRRPLTSDVNGIHSVQSSTPQAYRLVRTRRQPRPHHKPPTAVHTELQHEQLGNMHCTG
jgi:hypothetical protein